MKPPARARTEASTLIVSVFVITLVAVLLGISFEYTSRTAVLGRRSRDLVAAQALAEGALEVAFKRWQADMLKTGGVQVRSAADLASTVVRPDDIKTRVNAIKGHDGVTLSFVRVIPVDRMDNEILENPLTRDTQLNRMAATVPLQDHAGWTGRAYSFRAQAQATCDNFADTTGSVDQNGNPSNRLSVTVSRYFQKVQSSLFQAMLFFQDDLEIHAGPDFTLYGLVHSNSNFFAAGGKSGSLTFSSNVSYAGDKSRPVADLAAPNPIMIETNQKESNYINNLGYVDGITKVLAAQESGTWDKYHQPVYATDRNTQLSNVAPLDPLGTQAETAVPAAEQNDNTAGKLHEIIERPVPVSPTDPNPKSTQADPATYKSRRTFNAAGLRILINRNDPKQAVRVYGPDTTDPDWSNNGRTPKSVEIPVKGPPKKGDPDLRTIADYLLPAITPSAKSSVPVAGTDNSSGTGDIKDNREGREINLDTVDVSLLTPVLNNYADYNGVIFIADITNSTANPAGVYTGESSSVDAIRLKKGGVLPGSTNNVPNASGTEGMTIVSDGAVYVQGDYNTGTTYAADLPGNQSVPLAQPQSNAVTPDATKFTVPGYTQKPSAIMGDAVTILSNNWSDLNGKSDVNARIPKPTTFNAAILSGSVLTNTDTGGAASGGAHNFPRFLEKWDTPWAGKNTPFTYYGSMVELYTSTHFDGTYGKGNVYAAPTRRWFFDNNFSINPPPGSATSTSYVRGRWVRY